MDPLSIFGGIREIDITSLVDTDKRIKLLVRDDRTGNTGKRISPQLIFATCKENGNQQKITD